MDNVVTMQIGSTKLVGWKSVTVNRALDAIADSFNLSMVDVWDGDTSILTPDEKCKIYIEKTSGGKNIKELVLTGWIDSVNISADESSILVKVDGRSKSADIVDCSAEYLPSNSWNNTLLSTIIRDLMFDYDVDLDFISSAAYDKNSKLSLTINSGETIFEIIDRECKKRAILPVTNPYGNIELITSGDRISRDKLIFGENIVKASVDFDYSNRYGVYKVKAQKQGDGNGWQNSTNTIFAEATDAVFGKRVRRKIVVLDGAGSNQDAQKSANWESQIRAGRTGKLHLTIPTWFQSDNRLWEVGTLVYCQVPPLRIDEQLLINSIEFTQDDNGTLCNMDLVNKDTYAADPSKENKITKKSKKKGFGFGW